MSSITRPIIAVIGATGNQGGAVLRALLASNEFHVRAITRNPQSDAAKNLIPVAKKSQAELVAGDLTDPKSLGKAFAGAWGAFVVTQFWTKQETISEEEQAKIAADAALKAGVKTFLFSSLSDAHKISAGRHQVHHFTGKNKAEQYIRSLPFASASFPYAGIFATNWLEMMRPKKADDGVYEFTNIIRSDVALPMVDIEEEYGATVREIFRAPQKYHHQAVLTGTYTTMPQFVAAFVKATGHAARYVQLPVSAGKNFGAEVDDMLQFFNDNGYYGGVPINNIVKPTDVVEFWTKHAKEF